MGLGGLLGVQGELVGELAARAGGVQGQWWGCGGWVGGGGGGGVEGELGEVVRVVGVLVVNVLLALGSER